MGENKPKTNEKENEETNEKNERSKRKYKLLPLTEDFVFKNVFGKYGNEDILKRFLSAILNQNVTQVQIQNGELMKPLKDKKIGRLDVRAEINEKELVDIEMQVDNQHNLTERCLQYLCKLYSDQLNASETYTAIKKSILIAITTFDYYDRDEYHSIAHLKFDPNEEKLEEIEKQENIKKPQQELVTDKLEYHVINLKRFKKEKEPKGELANWLNLILGREREIKMAEKEVKEIEKAYKIIEELSQDPETAELYRLIQKGKIEENSTREFERNEGIKEGRKEGKKEEKKEIIKKMLEENFDIETISRITGLTKEEIKKLK